MSSEYNPIRHRKSRELEKAFKNGDSSRVLGYSCFGSPDFRTKCFMDCPLGESCLRFKKDKVRTMRKIRGDSDD